MTLALEETDRVVGGPQVPQVRRVSTEIPGPRSRALMDRQLAALPAGVGSVLPAFIEAAGGGVVIDAPIAGPARTVLFNTGF